MTVTRLCPQVISSDCVSTKAMNLAVSEETLRAHLRRILLPYALQHLTINYGEDTEARVNEVSQQVTYSTDSQFVAQLLTECLSLVSTEESGSVLIPLHPFEQLNFRWRFYELASFDYDEGWEIDRRALDLIRACGAKSSSIIPLESVLLEHVGKCCLTIWMYATHVARTKMKSFLSRIIH